MQTEAQATLWTRPCITRKFTKENPFLIAFQDAYENL
jgi:hypothetical protein